MDCFLDEGGFISIDDQYDLVYKNKQDPYEVLATNEELIKEGRVSRNCGDFILDLVTF
jgi:hypothetical protein